MIINDSIISTKQYTWISKLSFQGIGIKNYSFKIYVISITFFTYMKATIKIKGKPE